MTDHRSASASSPRRPQELLRNGAGREWTPLPKPGARRRPCEQRGRSRGGVTGSRRCHGREAGGSRVKDRAGGGTGTTVGAPGGGAGGCRPSSGRGSPGAQSPFSGSRDKAPLGVPRGQRGAPGAVVGASGAGEGGQRQPPASGARGQGGDGGGDPVLPKDWRFWIVDMRY